VERFGRSPPDRLEFVRIDFERSERELSRERILRTFEGTASQFPDETESLIRNDVTRVDSVLDSRFAYAQVISGSGAEHGIIDVLAITREGRLAILELKASEHIHLPLQAADYWLRVRRHSELREFRSYGYFPGVEIQKGSSTGLSACTGSTFPSGDRNFAGCSVTGDRSGSRGLDGKLAPRHSRGHAAIATELTTQSLTT
jgi:hypothetical protein